ncbi:HAD family hydrolase [Sutcliffiella cohnii]|uniref:HAD family hydrolase n=1 Tax=Sutcliffiella cohnii TaxID=33932 RepID=UPI002E1DEA06|nr:HAD family hydrolase [Sutcliffiella cohnii]
MKKAVFFDLDDTLLWDIRSVQTAFLKTCEYAAEQVIVNVEELEKAVRDEATKLYDSYETRPFTLLIGINPFEGLWGTFDDGTFSFPALNKIIREYQHQAWYNGLQKVGVDDRRLAKNLANRFIKERIKHPFVYEDTFPVLDALKNTYSLVLITNGAPSLQNMKLSLTPQLRPYFDHIIISGEFGEGKPNSLVFQTALQRTGLSPTEVWMVGDNLKTDILGANEIGIDTIWINHHNMEAPEHITPTYTVKGLNGILPIINE